jgi:hypothetical protein
MISSFADAVKRKSTEIIHWLYGAKRQDLWVTTLALHCAYVASLRLLRDTSTETETAEFIEILQNRDSNETGGLLTTEHVDKRVGIA